MNPPQVYPSSPSWTLLPPPSPYPPSVSSQCTSPKHPVPCIKPGLATRDLTEAEDIKKRWQEYTEKLYKKELHDPDNHDGVITHLEPDILECEVKWAWESITTNKASGGDRIPVELFQILKDESAALNMPANLENSSGHRTGKGQFSFQSLRKAMPKNAQTTTQLHSSHTLVK